jgi:O-antigen/teichoic acid export membrane protein
MTLRRPSLAWRATIAAADQAMLSATSFLISILLLRVVPKSEFGYYSVAMAIYLFLISLQNAVVNTPLTVLLASKKGADRKEYVASLRHGQFLFIIPACCLTLVAVALFRLGGLDPTAASIAGALGVASLGFLYREFLRSCLFAEEVPAQVLAMDVLYVAASLCFLAVPYLFFEIRVSIVFLLTGASALLVALLFDRSRGWQRDPKSVSKSYRENWTLGKWALLGVCITHVQNYSYLYLLGIFVGSLAVADVSAARLLLMPLILFQAGWGKIAIPHGSRLLEEGQVRRFFKEQIFTSIGFAVGVTAYVALVMAFSGMLQDHLFSEKYASSFRYVMTWGAIFVAGFIAMNASYGLQVMRDFRIITKVSSFTMIVTVGSAAYLIREYGITGGLAALLLGQVLLAVGLWTSFAKAVFSMAKGRRAVLLEKDGGLEFSNHPH